MITGRNKVSAGGAQNNTAAAEAAGAGAQQQALLKATWRRTRMGGITHPIALRLEDNKLRIIRPIREEYSRTGSHGVWYYRAEEVDILMYLEESNTGKRGVHVALCRLEPRQCRAVEAAAWSAWIVEALSTRQTEKRLEGLELAYER